MFWITFFNEIGVLCAFLVMVKPCLKHLRCVILIRKCLMATIKIGSWWSKKRFCWFKFLKIAIFIVTVKQVSVYFHRVGVEFSMKIDRNDPEYSHLFKILTMPPSAKWSWKTESLEAKYDFFNVPLFSSAENQIWKNDEIGLSSLIAIICTVTFGQIQMTTSIN